MGGGEGVEWMGGQVGGTEARGGLGFSGVGGGAGRSGWMMGWDGEGGCNCQSNETSEYYCDLDS